MRNFILTWYVLQNNSYDFESETSILSSLKLQKVSQDSMDTYITYKNLMGSWICYGILQKSTESSELLWNLLQTTILSTLHHNLTIII